MRTTVSPIAIVSAVLLASCGQPGSAANTSANATAPAANATAVRDDGAAAPQNTASPTAAAGARVVRIGIDGEHDMDACHTQGRISGQDFVGILDAPGWEARQVDQLEPGTFATLCETVGVWQGIVYPAEGTPDQDCGLGTNLRAPQPYSGPCASGWVPQVNFEVTAG